MNIGQGPWYLDDSLVFTVTTHQFDTGELVDADSPPSYRVYEEETSTPILTGAMALLDGSNTSGFYSEEIVLSAANGFEAGKTYSIYVTAEVDSVVGGTSASFKVSDIIPANIKQVNDVEVVGDGSEGTEWGPAP